ncbi:MAG: hypothetical protein HYZ81_20525 [Nitrospinae bacterium]|nr:hypothetical protein [Nitrospinota bacterium]
MRASFGAPRVEIEVKGSRATVQVSALPSPRSSRCRSSQRHVPAACGRATAKPTDSYDYPFEEVNVFGRATDPSRPGQPIWIVGEAKHNLTLCEVERFAQQVERARRQLPGEVYAVCFAYRARPEVRGRLQELGIPLVFSYGRFAERATTG